MWLVGWTSEALAVPSKIQIDGLNRLLAQLEAREKQARRDRHVNGVVSFGAPYAVYVHENLEARHPVGQAKFLEQPARERRQELSAITAQALRAGKSLSEAVLAACVQLKDWAVALTPLDTGFLRSSASARVERG